MSNPYAPPEDRPHAAGPGKDAGPTSAPGAVPTTMPVATPTGTPGPTTTPDTRAGARGDDPVVRHVPDPATPPAAGPAGASSWPLPPTPPAATPDRSPEGVPYERPRGAAPAGHAPHPTDVHRLAVLTRTTALLVLVGVLADLLRFPWYLAAGVLALAALVVGGRALAVAARTHQRGAPRAVLGLLMVVAVLGLARPGMALLTWDAESQYAACTAGALTVQAQNACTSDYEQALNDRAAELTSRTP